MKNVMRVALVSLSVLSAGVSAHNADASTESVNTLKTMKSESSAVKYNKAVTGGSVVLIDNGLKSAFNQNKFISIKKLNKEMLKLVNEGRKAEEAKSLKYAAEMQEGAEIRVKELVSTEVFSHIRPNHMSPSTAFKGIYKRYSFGENILSRQYNNNPYTLVSEKYLAEKLYEKWKASTTHKANMMRPSFNSTAVSIKFTKPGSAMTNKMYAVQVFTSKKY